MAIAANILGEPITKTPLVFQPSKRGVKYIYYCPATLKSGFDKLKKRIEKFIRRDDQSRSDVDVWVRKNFSRRNSISKKLNMLKDRTADEFCESLLNIKGATKSDKISFCNTSPMFVSGKFQPTTPIDRWLRGEKDDIATIAKVRELDSFLTTFCSGVNSSAFVNYRNFTVLQICQYIHNLLLFSEWQLENKQLTNDERTAIFKSIFGSEDDVENRRWEKIREQFENWLDPGDADLSSIVPFLLLILSAFATIC